MRRGGFAPTTERALREQDNNGSKGKLIKPSFKQMIHFGLMRFAHHDGTAMRHAIVGDLTSLPYIIGLRANKPNGSPSYLLIYFISNRVQDERLVKEEDRYKVAYSFQHDSVQNMTFGIVDDLSNLQDDLRENPHVIDTFEARQLVKVTIDFKDKMSRAGVDLPVKFQSYVANTMISEFRKLPQHGTVDIYVKNNEGLLDHLWDVRNAIDADKLNPPLSTCRIDTAGTETYKIQSDQTDEKHQDVLPIPVKNTFHDFEQNRLFSLMGLTPWSLRGPPRYPRHLSHFHVLGLRFNGAAHHGIVQAMQPEKENPELRTEPGEDAAQAEENKAKWDFQGWDITCGADNGCGW